MPRERSLGSYSRAENGGTQCERGVRVWDIGEWGDWVSVLGLGL